MVEHTCSYSIWKAATEAPQVQGQVLFQDLMKVRGELLFDYTSFQALMFHNSVSRDSMVKTQGP